jgi:hypothetical protein
VRVGTADLLQTTDWSQVCQIRGKRGYILNSDLLHKSICGKHIVQQTSSSSDLSKNFFTWLGKMKWNGPLNYTCATVRQSSVRLNRRFAYPLAPFHYTTFPPICQHVYFRVVMPLQNTAQAWVKETFVCLSFFPYIILYIYMISKLW